MLSERTAHSDVSRRVLVIDDEEPFRRFMERLISDFGFPVTTRGRLDRADLAGLSASDMVFIDLMMPGIDGIQALDVLARSHVRSSIVLMSGSHGQLLQAAETIAKRSGLRVVSMLRKPFRSADIRRILELEQADAPRPAKQPLPSEINVEDVVAGLERQEFDAFLQPIVDLRSGEPMGYEALARWHSDKFQLVMPQRFIAVAARHGILPLLTRQILDRALGYAVKLKQRGQVCNISVNLGAEDLLDSELPEKIADMVAKHDLPPQSLTLELTESSTATNEVMMLGILARLRLKGVNLAIDDFGTAYSGLERLSTIPFTALKIDMRFISDMITNMNARAIIQSSIALARRLGMRVVAEGIETDAQLSLLREMGCDLGQGYLIARPMTLQNLLDWRAGTAFAH